GQDPQKFLGASFRDSDRDGIDFRPLVRYFDLRALPYYPGDEAREAITTREDRMQISDVKNKTVEDEYTRANMKPEYEERVEAVLKSMRVKDALLLIAHAIEDQENRDALWLESLNSALEAEDFAQYIQPVIERVKAA
ncbi:hypothetical protein KDA14_02305, partial [Candidatus Saccharibacteria bacterium]|nr:hypothetical protein [Candidatus Saccharibacteria bacterium]